MSIHNDPHEMINAFTDAKCAIVLSDTGVCYLYDDNNDELVSDTLAIALNDKEFAQYLVIGKLKQKDAEFARMQKAIKLRVVTNE